MTTPKIKFKTYDLNFIQKEPRYCTANQMWLWIANLE